MLSVVTTAQIGFGMGKKPLRPKTSGSTRSAQPPPSRLNQITSRVDLFQISQIIAFLTTLSILLAVFGAGPPPAGDFAALSSVHLSSSWSLLFCLYSWI